MNPLNVSALAQEGVDRLQKPWTQLSPSWQKGLVVLGAVVVAGILTAGVCHLTGSGNVGVLKQRLLGEVKLSTGVYSARSVGQLNELSWENGLRILETLDRLNQSLDKLAQAPTTATQKTIDRTMRQLENLLADRKVLLETARVFETRELYTPVFQDYLNETMTRHNSLKLARNPDTEPAKTTFQ